MRHVHAIRHRVFAAHGAVVAILLFGFALGRHRHAGNGVLQRHDRLNRTGKRDLHRAAHLAAVGARGHDCAKGTHVKEVLAHPVACLAYLVGAAFALFFLRRLLFDIGNKRKFCYVFSSILGLRLGGCSQF